MVDRLEKQVRKERRDVTVLKAVIRNAPIGIVSLAEETGIPEHEVRYSLRMLESDGTVEPTPTGAVPADDIEDRIAGMNAGIDELVERLEGIKTDMADSVPADPGGDEDRDADGNTPESGTEAN